VMEALAVAIVETAGAWEQDGVAAGEVRDIIGAVDETFLEQMTPHSLYQLSIF
jgi:hypothetical protein